jgi:hypothetical protein
VRAVAQQQLDQIATEVAKPRPHAAIVGGLLRSLRAFAQSAVNSAGAGAGTLLLTKVLGHWPL